MTFLVARSNRVDERGGGTRCCGELTPVTADDLKALQVKRPRGSKWEKGTSQIGLKQNWRLHPFRYVLTILFLMLPQTWGKRSHQAHQPFEWTLHQVGIDDDKVIQTIITPGAPAFKTTLCQLAPVDGACKNEGTPFYLCPSSNPGKSYCNQPGQHFCAYWGCETIANRWIPEPGKDPFLKVSWAPYGCKPQVVRTLDRSGSVSIAKWSCNYWHLNVTRPQDPSWLVGRTWGVRYYKELGQDRGGLIHIKKKPASNDPLPVGPKQVLTDDLAKKTDPDQTLTDSLVKETEGDVTKVIVMNSTQAIQTPDENSGDNPLWKLMQASYLVLNHTNPN